MKLIAKGEQQFQFSASLGLEFLGLKEGSEKSVRLAIIELKEHGFIYCVKFSNGGGNIPNTFAFSTDFLKWKKH